jgi:hypothetical protein
MGAIVLLGPQRLERTLSAALADLGVDPAAPVAAVTAGWREREGETGPMEEHLARPVHNLALYARSEDAVERDLELSLWYRERLGTVLQTHDLYKVRLGAAMQAARELLGREGAAELLDPAREAALRAVREVDAWHLQRLAELREEFRAWWRVEERPVVEAHRKELRALLDPCPVVCIAGGDVAALRNRMLLFDLPSLIGDRHVVAWSAGSMACGDRVVLFHDEHPHGPADPEILGSGLALASDLIAFPHADARLHLGDRVRMELLARRFEPSRCVAFGAGTRLVFESGSLVEARRARRITADGRVLPLEAA